MARSEFKASGSTPPQPSDTLAQKPGGSPSPTGGAAPRPFVPATFDLPKLDDDGDDYDLWSTILTLALQNRGLWPIVNGSETAPDATTDPAAYHEWYLMDQEAQLMIFLALKKVGQECVCRTRTSKESWDRLKARYSNCDGHRTVSLLAKVLLTTFTDTEPLQPQLDGVIFATHQLESANVIIPDLVLAYLLAFRLPESYSTLRIILTCSDSTKISSRWVADQVIAEERYRITQSGCTASAFFAKAKATKRE